MKEISFTCLRGETKVFKKLIAFGLLNQGYAFAAETGFVKIRQGHEVYVEYTKAKAGRPTLVLVNGLVYDLRYWDDYIRRLTDDGIGVVLYNFRGQSKTLLREVDQRRTP
jgi:predicted alpha/beta-fold hydrolase